MPVRRLLVPLTALNASRGQSYVWVRSENAAADEPGVRTVVETGLSDENYAQVVSGLNEGDVILITREADESTAFRNNGGFGGGMMNFGGGMPSMPSGGSRGGRP